MRQKDGGWNGRRKDGKRKKTNLSLRNHARLTESDDSKVTILE